MYLFFLYRFHWKANVVNQTILYCVRKRLTIDQSNVQTVMAENQEQYTLSNIIYIEFQNISFFLGYTLKQGLLRYRQIY